MNNLGNLAKKAGPAWSREFDQLIRAIGECKSKAEEDAIIGREVDLLKPKLKDAKADKRYLKELVVRLMYVEMLGHDASWGHVKALQACSDTNLLTKKVSLFSHPHMPCMSLASWEVHLATPTAVRSPATEGMLQGRTQTPAAPSFA